MNDPLLNGWPRCLPGATLSRRGVLRGLAGLALALPLGGLLAACGDDGDDDTSAGSEPATPTPGQAATPAGTSAAATATAPAAAATPDGAGSPTGGSPSAGAGAAFPVTIAHAFGTTTLEAAPERVVTIGFSEQDAVLALGVVPVAVREWFGAQPHAVWPWAQDALGDGEPQVLTMTFGELDYEAIATLEPDLLVATHAGITAQEYATLSEIAPTLAQGGDYPDFGMPWQEQTRAIGRALGRAERAEELVAAVEQRIADAAGAHPEFNGASLAWASPTGDGQFWVVGPNTPPMRFLSALGFVLPGALAELVGDLDSGQLSGEQVNLLDTDVLIFQATTDAERAALESDPLFQGLAVAAEGRTIFFVGLDDPLYGALSFSTVLSLPFAVEHLVPRLALAIDGDPATEAPV